MLLHTSSIFAILAWVVGARISLPSAWEHFRYFFSEIELLRGVGVYGKDGLYMHTKIALVFFGACYAYSTWMKTKRMYVMILNTRN